jgi:signal transduction histidine kinase
VFVVSILLESRFATINDTMRLGAVVFGTIFILASVAAWVIAGRILRPLSDLRDTAQSISDSDLSRRIDVKGDDEIAELGRTFNSMLDRLDDAFATQRRFIDDAGHELRTPITVIRGNLEVMSDDPEERAESIALVTRELDRMTRIVNDLLDLAKVEQPDFIQPAPIDMADFIHDVVRRASALDDRPWKVERADQAVIEADEDRLGQAMMNLVRNAVEHTSSGSPVYIGGRLGWSVARLWVRDEGETISEADRARIFGRFSRVGSGARSTDGAGLGLSIVAAIAEAHGGEVTVDEAREGGNIFTITIPASSKVDPS